MPFRRISSVSRRAGLIVTFIAGGIFVPACDDSRDTASSEVRYATGDELIAYINTVASADRPQVERLFELVECETPVQGRVLALCRTMREILPLSEELTRRFKTSLWLQTAWVEMPWAFPCEPLQVMSSSESRVEAQCRCPLSREPLHRVQLIKTAKGWRISGYTFEHDPMWQEVLPDLDLMEHALAVHAYKALDGAERVQRGEFADASEFTRWRSEMLSNERPDLVNDPRTDRVLPWLRKRSDLHSKR